MKPSIATITTCWPIPTSTRCRSAPCGTSTPSRRSAALKAGKHVFEKADFPPSPMRARSPRRRRAPRASLHRPRRPLQPRYRTGQAGHRRGSHRSHRGAVVAAQHPRRLDPDHPSTRSARSSATPSTTPTSCLWFTGDSIVLDLRPDGRRRGLKHPDIGQTMYRFQGRRHRDARKTVWCMPEKTPFDIDERMSIIGTEGSSTSRTRSPIWASSMPPSCIRPTPPIGRCSMATRSGALRDEFVYFANVALTGGFGHRRYAGRRNRRA